jgi:hypothetical protein
VELVIDGEAVGVGRRKQGARLEEARAEMEKRSSDGVLRGLNSRSPRGHRFAAEVERLQRVENEQSETRTMTAPGKKNLASLQSAPAPDLSWK